jgi:hypothetical protein
MRASSQLALGAIDHYLQRFPSMLATPASNTKESDYPHQNRYAMRRASANPANVATIDAPTFTTTLTAAAW